MVLAAALVWGCGGGPAIHDVQGDGPHSPFAGSTVTVEGVITAVAADGFFLQSRRADRNGRTSEGIFVLGPTERAPGERVRVSGVVEERRGGERELTVTTLVATGDRAEVAPLGRERELPLPVTLDSLPDELSAAIARWESLEGMLVEIAGARVVGPTDAYGEAVVLLAGDARRDLPRTPRGGLALVADANDVPFPFRVTLDDALAPLPPLRVGDRLDAPLIGVVDYRFGTYRVLPLAPLAPPPQATDAAAALPPAPPETLSIATFNAQSLDLGDEPSRFRRLAALIVGGLAAPDLLALQEVQDDSGPLDDGVVSSEGAHRRLIAAIAAQGGPPYAFREVRPLDGQDGGAPGANIRSSLLARQDRGIRFADRAGDDPARQSTLALLDEAGRLAASPSPGRLGIDEPAFRDTRKPLVVQLEIDEEPFFAIVCHLSSKRGDDLPFGAAQPPRRLTEKTRVTQARTVARFVSDLLTLDPDARVVVLGDLNDFTFSAPLAELEAAGLENALLELAPTERYTYVFQGVSQALDHVLLSPALVAAEPPSVAILHVNAEHPAAERLSDHDPVVVRIPRRPPWTTEPGTRSSPPTTAPATPDGTRSPREGAP
ncbi:MAG TPA: endonuclease/exonuclease/phosphatase family protein [Thermoanaerobaculia bacterium]|nr:endonuclease/exonuclease/phosphatase family protein [Thermoanaerobaculia bacterium]